MARKRKPKTSGKRSAKEPPAAAIVEGQTDAPAIVKDQIEAARRLGVTDRTLRNWMKNRAFPDWSAGFDIAAIRQFAERFDLSTSKTRQEANDTNQKLKDEKLKQEEIKTKRLELDMLEREGQLLPRETQELALAKIFTDMGDRLDQIVDLCRGQCCKGCKTTLPTWLKGELDKWREGTAERLKTLSPS